MYSDFLILGGAGLVGLQVCRHICGSMQPKRIVVASLLMRESEVACERLREEFGGGISFISEAGNLFVPTDLAHTPRGEIMASPALRHRLLEALYDDFETAYEHNHLARLIGLHQPEVIVDCVNTATGLSYQDVFDGAAKVREWIQGESYSAEGVQDLEAFLLTQSTPQLIRHVRLLHRATTEHRTRVYLKVGTTGTGGMGLNIPYTHSEDKPSKKLLAKTETAFAHTGLLFLFARTPRTPIVKEVKPGAMIGYRGVTVQEVTDRHGNADLFTPRTQSLSGDRLQLRDDVEAYEKAGRHQVAVVDTGENGLFTRGEFAAITALGQMEYITPEEIARVVVREIRGANTGQDIISALDASVLNPSYKAGLVRNAALTDLALAEDNSKMPSVALGRLGPPELSKLLFEAHLLKIAYGNFSSIVPESVTGRAMSEALAAIIDSSRVSRIAPSIGIPILLPDGEQILRGPRINVPELVGHSTTVSLSDVDKREGWIRKGWIDLRPANMEVWQARFRKMLAARRELRSTGSAAANRRTYFGDTFEIGEVVAWIFNNEMDGYRVK